MLVSFASRYSAKMIAALSTFFTQVFTLDLIALFLAAFVSVTKILFFADLILANVCTSKIFYHMIFKCDSCVQ